MSIRLTEADCQNVSWQLTEVTPDYRRYVGRGTHPITGLPITVQKTEFIAEDALLDRNAEERNDTDHTKWSQGTGSDRNGVPLVKVASIPLNKFLADFAQHLREGDTDFSRWWLNRDENSPFRTRRGRV